MEGLANEGSDAPFTACSAGSAWCTTSPSTTNRRRSGLRHHRRQGPHGATGRHALPALRGFSVVAAAPFAQGGEQRRGIRPGRAGLGRARAGLRTRPNKKIQLLRHLSQQKDPRAPSLVAPYLADMDEGVRFAAVESLLRLKNEEVAREALLQVFVSDTEESLRLRIRIAEGSPNSAGWCMVPGRRGKKLPEGFQLDREGHILDRKRSE